jgi:hypothetical protein
MRGDPQKGDYMYISDLIIQQPLISKHDEKEHSSIFLKKETTKLWKGLSNSKQQSLACSGSFNKINIYGIDPPTIICYTTYPLTSSLPGNGRRTLRLNIAQRSKRNEKQKKERREKTERSLTMRLSVPRFEGDALPRLQQSSLHFRRRKSPDFRVLLKTTRHRSHPTC